MSEKKSYEVISDFFDSETEDVVKAGSYVEVDEFRAKVLNDARVIKLVEVTQAISSSDQTKADVDQKDDQVLETYPKHTGGGYFELSNGEKVQGKENAVEKQQELDEAASGGDNLVSKPEKD